MILYHLIYDDVLSSEQDQQPLFKNELRFINLLSICSIENDALKNMFG